MKITSRKIGVGLTMLIYNTYTREKEEFKPIEENKVKMYICGPTVYNYIHIGNARPVLFFDLVHRYFKYLGYEVEFVSNVTDVDDKIINRAIEEEVTEAEIAEKYLNYFLECNQLLNALPFTSMPKVTENMDEMIQFIHELVERGFAYAVDGDVYFRIDKVREYGQLSGKKIEELEVGARIAEDSKKENPLDFVLWKKTDKGITWDSPWGAGRPGWHTECVVMIGKEFGGKIDIHGGGTDLQFPHHENEIAQSICMNGHSLANYWMHVGRLGLNNEKMSKSLGNGIYLSDPAEVVQKKVMSMYTDPNHIRIEDPGQVEGNMVFTYLDVFGKEKEYIEELKEHYRHGGLGDVKIKRYLIDVLEEELAPIRRRREELAKNPEAIMEMLHKGSLAAEKVAAQTLTEVKKAMGIQYF